VQRRCARVRQTAFVFARLHEGRLRALAPGADVTVLPGEWAGAVTRPSVSEGEPVVVFAGRHIPEKRVPALVGAIARARELRPELGLRCEIFGDGPERGLVEDEVGRLGVGEWVTVRGRVEGSVIEERLGAALCMALPSRREGYGLVVLEAASKGTPSVVVADEDNAAVELVEDGVNGVVASSASADDLAAAVLRVADQGRALRESTADWFAANAEARSIERSLRVVLKAYSS
jgi:glycosyltransferase involved in cell wall biosynthesis